MELKTKREVNVELVNKLFVYTDSRQWEKLVKEVFRERILFDMQSMGAGAAKELSAKEICEMWHKGFEGIDQVHHQSGNFIVSFRDEDGIEADVFCYAVATHYREKALQGKTREFVGSYQIHTSFTDQGWRIKGFKYNLKYTTGNADLK